MKNYAIDIIGKYRSSGIILDTNMLLLYFVGALNPEIIPTFKRTSIFTKEDYTTLTAIIDVVPKFIITPNIVTEVSNLLNQLPDHHKEQCFEILANTVTNLDEEYISSNEIAQTQLFKKFGITDAGMMILARKYLIITVDFPLSNYISSKLGLDVLNFNHIRSLSWY